MEVLKTTKNQPQEEESTLKITAEDISDSTETEEENPKEKWRKEERQCLKRIS